MQQKMSKGEQKVANLLRQAGIGYEQEVEFKGLKGARENLRFDFVLLKYGRPLACLEVDGRQHFEYVKFFHKTPIGFRRQKEYDIKKNKFCLKYNIPLIRVPYWKLDNLTVQTLFNDKSMLVKNENHNINLINKGVRK